jgi:hypothetical protein
MGQLPNWLVILFAIVLTLITGAECTALLMHGWFMVDDPDALRDGQYVFVFFLGGSAGTAAVIPTAVMGAVMVARRPDFVRYLTVTLALITALGRWHGLTAQRPCWDKRGRLGRVRDWANASGDYNDAFRSVLVWTLRTRRGADRRPDGFSGYRRVLDL